MGDVITGLVALVVVTFSAIFLSFYANNLIDDINQRRELLNIAQNYLDVVTDRGSVSEVDYKALIQDLAGTGYIYDVAVLHEIRLVYKDDVVYTPKVLTTDVGKITPADLKQGDLVTVKITSKRTLGLLGQADISLGRVNRN